MTAWRLIRSRISICRLGSDVRQSDFEHGKRKGAFRFSYTLNMMNWKECKGVERAPEIYSGAWVFVRA